MMDIFSSSFKISTVVEQKQTITVIKLVFFPAVYILLIFAKNFGSGSFATLYRCAYRSKSCKCKHLN